MIFLFEAVLIAGLQAFIFSILTAIYLGGAVSEPLNKRRELSSNAQRLLHFFGVLHPLILTVEPIIKQSQDAGRAIALGVGAGGGAAGAGAGIGAVFNASIQAKTRQPELRAEVERDQWLGFALTEACFFYGLVGGFIAFFL